MDLDASGDTQLPVESAFAHAARGAEDATFLREERRHLLEDVPLTDVLTAAAEASEVPIITDHYAIEAEGIELSELKVTVPMRKTTWGLLLKQVTFPHKLGRRIVADESGKPFVLITTLKESLKTNPAAKSERS